MAYKLQIGHGVVGSVSEKVVERMGVMVEKEKEKGLKTAGKIRQPISDHGRVDDFDLEKLEMYIFLRLRVRLKGMISTELSLGTPVR